MSGTGCTCITGSTVVELFASVKKITVTTAIEPPHGSSSIREETLPLWYHQRPFAAFFFFPTAIFSTRLTFFSTLLSLATGLDTYGFT
ncbi:hypothetical protein DPMN_119679 [Dreissena polymorpha]|uniref:Uncharacterized protein n=1 Tax=Dreissena polymorpha TaxID=45954 RepID=A0A9D4GM55_DREPO|nr:hypothetical protein DPMN_119679 [Dreissena polymorpha]